MHRKAKVVLAVVLLGFCFYFLYATAYNKIINKKQPVGMDDAH